MDVKTSTDSQLIEALRSQSIEALEELYDRYNRVAMAVAYRVLGDRNLAEDVLQEAFLAVWRQAGGFSSGRGSVRSWFLSIVRHRAIDVTRGKVFSRERLSLDQIVWEARYPDIWTEVSANLDRESIQNAVSELPDEQRETIMLAYFGGLSQREIAEKLEIPLGTVKGRTRLGMQKLRALFVEANDRESQ